MKILCLLFLLLTPLSLLKIQAAPSKKRHPEEETPSKRQKTIHPLDSAISLDSLRNAFEYLTGPEIYSLLPVSNAKIITSQLNEHQDIHFKIDINDVKRLKTILGAFENKNLPRNLKFNLSFNEIENPIELKQILEKATSLHEGILSFQMEKISFSNFYRDIMPLFPSLERLSLRMPQLTLSHLACLNKLKFLEIVDPNAYQNEQGTFQLFTTLPLEEAIISTPLNEDISFVSIKHIPTLKKYTIKTTYLTHIQELILLPNIEEIHIKYIQENLNLIHTHISVLRNLIERIKNVKSLNVSGIASVITDFLITDTSFNIQEPDNLNQASDPVSSYLNHYIAIIERALVRLPLRSCIHLRGDLSSTLLSLKLLKEIHEILIARNLENTNPRQTSDSPNQTNSVCSKSTNCLCSKSSLFLLAPQSQ